MSRKVSIILILLIFGTLPLSAQFQGQFKQVGPPGSQQNQQNQNDTSYLVEAREKYTLKRYFNSLAGKDSMDIARMWGGSLVLPGTAQLYNKQYWKIPVLYLSTGGLMLAGYQNNLKWLDTKDQQYKERRNLYYAGAALTYWVGIVDGISNYKYHKEVLPARASLYSVMFPGLGQIYNGDYWKLPIYYGGFIISGYFVSSNNAQFKRYKTMYYNTSNPESEEYQKYNAETMKYYMDTYRRFRDYSILSFMLVYALNVIDANVFAHLQDFDVSDDLTLKISPSTILPIAPLYTSRVSNSVGLKLTLSF